MSAFERQSVISGIGQSAIGRRLDRTGVDLTIEAAKEAVADAGLTFADIDGLSTYPGAGGAGGAGFAGPGVVEMQDALRLELNWYSGSAEGAAQIQAVINAVMAVGAGLARHVLVYRTVTEATEQGSGGRRPISAGGGGASGMVQWTLPFHRVLRRELVGALRAAPLPRVRHDPRAARPDRAQRPAQRDVEPEGDPARTDDDGRLLLGAHDHDAVLPVRLRHPRRRFDGGRGVGGGARAATSTTRRPSSRRSAPGTTVARRGTSGLT